MSEAQRKTAREERVSMAVQKRKVSPPPEGSPTHGLIYKQIVLVLDYQSFRPIGLAHLLRFKFRIRESFKLDKILRVTESNHYAYTTMSIAVIHCSPRGTFTKSLRNTRDIFPNYSGCGQCQEIIVIFLRNSK